MKLTISMLLLALLAACSHSSRNDPQWESLANPDPNAFNQDHKNDDIYFVDTQNGWVITSTGNIYRTVDEGNSWELQFHASVYFRCLGFANQQKGWAGNLLADSDNVLYQTLDGGENWTPVEGLAEQGMRGLCGIHVLDQETIFGVGRVFGPSHFLRSTDGGTTWTVKDMSQYAGFLIDVNFRDRLNGFAIGGTNPDLSISSAVMLVTSDGGETWSERYRSNRPNEWGWKFQFPTANVGYASIQTFRTGLSGLPEYFLKTTDGGQTWTEKTLGTITDYSMQGIGFANPDLGWIGSWHGDRPSLMTEDGGDTWREADFGVRLNRFRFLGDKFGYVVGSYMYKFSPQ